MAVNLEEVLKALNSGEITFEALLQQTANKRCYVQFGKDSFAEVVIDHPGTVGGELVAICSLGRKVNRDGSPRVAKKRNNTKEPQKATATRK